MFKHKRQHVEVRHFNVQKLYDVVMYIVRHEVQGGVKIY